MNEPNGVHAETPSPIGVLSTEKATTTFIDNKEIVQSAYAEFPLHDEHLNALGDTSESTLVSFLKRPVALHSGVLSTTNPIHVPITLHRVLVDTLIAGGNNIGYDKIKGNMGIRATTCYKLVVNATRFQQGRYMLCYVPTGGIEADPTWYVNHSQNLLQRTQLPRVEIDLATQTSCEIKIPYLSVTPFYAIGASLRTVTGYIYLFPYSPLEASSGPTTVSYTLYSWLEDITLTTPVVPQSGRKMVLRKKTPISETQEREKEISSNTPVATSLKTISQGLKVMSGIPLLEPVFAPASWATGVASGIAAYFGWSSPIMTEPVQRTKIDPAFGFTCSDVPRLSHPLSLTSVASVSNYPRLSLTDEDELSFESFARRSSYLTQFDFTTTGVSGDQLYSLDLKPLTMKATFSYAGYPNSIQHTPVSFLADCFDMWKMDIKIKFKFVKTEFHSGRLCFAYFPAPPGFTSGPTTYSTSPFVERAIVDLREGNEIDIVCPYRALTPFLRKDESMGSLRVFIVDNLQSPSTVPSTVRVLVEVSAMNVNMQVPSSTRFFLPTYNFVRQSGTEVVLRESHNLGSSSQGSLSSDTVCINETCIGEKITSFRQLLKKFERLPFTSADSYPSRLNVCLHVAPVMGATLAGAGAVANVPAGANTYFANMASMFCFFRGGRRLALTLEDTSQATFALELDTRDDSNITSIVRYTNEANSTLDYASQYALFSSATSKITEVQLPQYNNAPARPTASMMCTLGGTTIGAIPAKTSSYYNSPMIVRTTLTSTDQTFTLYSSIADDGDFSTFISIPLSVESYYVIGAYFSSAN